MIKISRRQFLITGAGTLLGPGLLDMLCPFTPALAQKAPKDIRGRIFTSAAPEELWKWSHEGFLYEKLERDRVVCGICPNSCMLSPGDRSICRSKVNIDGKLYSLTYGNPCSVNVDPIEKKPLFHFLPKTTAFSIAAAGCNFRCLNCQNWEISQVRPQDVRTSELFPPDVVRAAKSSGSASIAYTYSEPIAFFEYMIDTARLARQQGINNLWISNGYINTKPLLELSGVLDAANVNLKAFSDGIYRKLNGGRLEPVLNTFRTMHEAGLHFEITNLVVPGYTDDQEMAEKMCSWIVENLGPDHPLHFLRFFPRYKLDRLPPTPVETLVKFRQIAMKAGIRYVYVGNVPNNEGNNTYCHNCSKLLVERRGYHIPVLNIEDGRCRFCNTKIPGRWA
ncbi:MAG TPA: AmmeMemoRadiSam system radical SAM enzyme [Deltaproteobacteria bacterium]|nr:AmmeMemoRadiSam system radical SAM enzyme [Deltaproteobacteria bacterium]